MSERFSGVRMRKKAKSENTDQKADTSVQRGNRGKFAFKKRKAARNRKTVKDTIKIKGVLKVG